MAEIVAKANVGAGTDKLLTFANGSNQHAGAVVLVDTAGNALSTLPVSAPAVETLLGDIEAKTLPAGQTTMANSSPVVIASDQASISVKKTADVFEFSSLNSSSSQLTAGASFVGGIENVVDQRAYSILFFSDQNATITIAQFSDAAGTKLAQSLVYSYVANQPFARSGAMNGNYIRVTVQNTGGSTTTALRLDTAFGDIEPSTQLNNTPVAIMEVGGTAVGTSVPIGPPAMTVQTYSQAGVIAINTDLLVIDCTSLRGLSIQCASMGTTGVVTAAWSDDNTNFPVSNTLMTPAGALAATFNAAGIWTTRVYGRYLRLRLTTATTAGTTTIHVLGSTLPLGQPVSQPISGTVSVSGTLTTAGPAAHSAAASGNPVQIGGVVATAVSTAEVAGDACRLQMSTGGAAIIRPYAVPELDWSYAAAAGGITNTTDVAIKAAAGAGVRNYLTSISVTNASATIATEVVIKDGATIIWRGFVGTQALLNSAVNVTFPTPLKSTANTALNVACITTGAAVYVNAQGHIGA